MPYAGTDERTCMYILTRSITGLIYIAHPPVRSSCDTEVALSERTLCWGAKSRQPATGAGPS